MLKAKKKLSVPNILFIHGVGASKNQWQWVIKALKSFMDYNPILIDLPGHGDSESFVSESVDGAASDILNYLKTINISDPLYIVGHSLGGLISLKLVFMEPDLFKKIVVINTGMKINLNEEFVEKLRCQQVTVEEISQFFDQTIDKKIMNLMFEDFKKLNLETAQSDFMNLKAENIESLLADLKVPTLVISSKNDTILSARKSSELSRKILDSSLIKLLNRGHYPHLEDPESIAKIISLYLNL